MKFSAAFESLDCYFSEAKNSEISLALYRKSLKSTSSHSDGSHFDQEDPHVFVILGASVSFLPFIWSVFSHSLPFQGDLAKKKIYPTLWWLYRDNLLPVNTVFFGYARSKTSVQEIKDKCSPYMKVKPIEQKQYEEFWKINYYFSGQYDSRRDFEILNQELSTFEKRTTANRLFYLALPPSVYELVTVHIRESCMAPK